LLITEQIIEAVGQLRFQGLDGAGRLMGRTYFHRKTENLLEDVERHC
jgi:hypothetical protein